MTGKASFVEICQRSWSLFENALSVQLDITYSRSSLRGVQALVLMVYASDFSIRESADLPPGLVYRGVGKPCSAIHAVRKRGPPGVLDWTSQTTGVFMAAISRRSVYQKLDLLGHLLVREIDAEQVGKRVGKPGSSSIYPLANLTNCRRLMTTKSPAKSQTFSLQGPRRVFGIVPRWSILLSFHRAFTQDSPALEHCGKVPQSWHLLLWS